jgi:hypothetical protein
LLRALWAGNPEATAGWAVRESGLLSLCVAGETLRHSRATDAA